VPRQLVRARDHDRNRSLGWLATAWLEALAVHGPGDVQGEPVRHGDEYTAFIVDCYAVGEDGRRLYDSAFLSRPKGCDKSGLLARLALFEALGPCRTLRIDPHDPDSDPVFAVGGEVYRDPWGLGFEYVYEPGEPMGRPVKVPFIRCLATEEGQTGNVYDSVHFNLTEGPLAGAMARKDDAGLTRVLLPGGGEIVPSTASSSAKDGGKETFVGFDETHLYVRPELRGMYAVVTRNLRKRKRLAETWYLETTTMYRPGEESVAEETYKLAELIAEGQAGGRAKVKRERLLLDHRWGEIDLADLADEKMLAAALTEAYGDALAWNHLPGLIDEVLEPRADVADSVRYFLNDRTSAENSWLAHYEWSAVGPKPDDPGSFKVVADRDVVTLGFDGSRKRARGVTDATALIGCRVSDRHIFEIGIWEQPRGAAGKDWAAPVGEVLAAVDEAFAKYTVVGFYADPAKWESHVAGWEAKYGRQLKVKSSREHPIEWWMTGGRAAQTVRALERFQSAVIDRELTHDGSSTLTRHVLAARMIHTRSGVQIGKEHPSSERKVDGAVAATLALACGDDALAAGLGATPVRRVPRRIR
jgi:hypothetical protein